MANETKSYVDFHYPLPVVEQILKLLGKTNTTTAASAATDTANREWFSQPRPGSDNTTECITVSFRLPLSVSELSTEILRMPCVVEVWYQDRSNNWRPVMTPHLTPLKVSVESSDTKSWYKWSTTCYPIVAKKVQFRLIRSYYSALKDEPYPVGMRNTLIRRNVYDRSQGGAFEDDTDMLGNVVSKYIKDWDASRANDDNYTTFWKSAPQPDPAAVVSLYLDVRNHDGGPQTIDKVYLDPVYAGQHLNLYYSSDDSTGALMLSPISLPPVADTANISWKRNKGLTDTATGDADATYNWRLSVGPQTGQDSWVGVHWQPNFASDGANLPNDPVLFSAADPDGDDLSTNRPELRYDPTNRQFVLTFRQRQRQSATATQVVTTATYTSSAVPFGGGWAAGEDLMVVAGWKYADSPTVRLRVVDSRGTELAVFDEPVDDLPQQVSFSGVTRIANWRGTLVNLIVKLESYDLSSVIFQGNPSLYCDPDPVLPDDVGRYPTTTVTDAIYVAPFLSREHGSGGSDDSHFEGKVWTPIWRDYTATKGMLFLPQPVSMKYLKLEFSNLNEEPYPIYESGIDVKYKVFPVQVTQQSSIGPRLYTGEGGFLGMGTFISMNGVRSVNWLDPTSVLTAIGSAIGPQQPPVLVDVGVPYVTDHLPNQGISALQQSQTIEASNAYVYARDAIKPYVLADDHYTTTIKAEGLQVIQPYVDVPWQEIDAANPGSISKVKSTGTVPIRGTDWWIYPGQQLKVPASVMRKLTETSVVTERKLTLESRVRFTTTTVHRYETRTLRRDAGIAYFAGVREVQPYTSTYFVGEDKPVNKFPIYDDQQWVFTNIEQRPSGPVSAKYPSIPGVLTKTFESKSSFSKVSVAFQDSGLIRSDSMWADPDENMLATDDTQLSPYTDTIPSTKNNSFVLTLNGAPTGGTFTLSYHEATTDPIAYNMTAASLQTVLAGLSTTGDKAKVTVKKIADAKYAITLGNYDDVLIADGAGLTGGTDPDAVVTLAAAEITATWEDPLHTWRDPNAVWGSPYGLVSMTLDNDRRYQGRRVLHFNRAGAQGGRAGLSVIQYDNFTPGAQFRLGAVFFRPEKDTGNDLILTLRRSDGVVIHEETIDSPPTNQWFEYTTRFVEIPETLANSSFDNGLQGWVAHGGNTWTPVTDFGHTGGDQGKSVSILLDGDEADLLTEPMDVINGSTVHCSAWVTWDGLTVGETPAIRLRALFYDADGELSGSTFLDGAELTIGQATASGWVPISGSVVVPTGQAAVTVALQLVIDGEAGNGGTVWVDDFSADVPGAARQRYVAELTVAGDNEEDLYVSNLYTEVTPIRYFITLGDNLPIEVTDLRYTKDVATTTTTDPVTTMRVQAVIATQRAWAFGCEITPAYLK